MRNGLVELLARLFLQGEPSVDLRLVAPTGAIEASPAHEGARHDLLCIAPQLVIRDQDLEEGLEVS